MIYYLDPLGAVVLLFWLLVLEDVEIQRQTT